MGVCARLYLCFECDVFSNANTSEVVDKNSDHVTQLEVKCALDHSQQEDVRTPCVCVWQAV